MKKLLALFLVFSLLALSGNLYAKERRGAKLVIEKKDGQSVRGELIAVKENSLLLLDSKSGADVSVNIEDVRVITIKKKSKAWLGAGIGFLIGAVSGYIGFYLGTTDRTSSERSEEGFKGGLVIGLLGLIPGAGIGAMLGTDKTIQIEGKSESEIGEILEDLRSKARVPDYQ